MGSIVRAKTLPLHLTGSGQWRDPTKYQGSTIAIASGVASSFWVAPTTHPIQTEMENWNEKKLSIEGSRLSPLASHTHWLQNNGIWKEANPEQQVITTVQVRQTGWPVWYHRRWYVSSVAGDLPWRSCPLPIAMKKIEGQTEKPGNQTG